MREWYCKCKLTLGQNNFEDVKKGVMVIPSCKLLVISYECTIVFKLTNQVPELLTVCKVHQV